MNVSETPEELARLVLVRVVAALLSLTGILLLTGMGAARADKPTVIQEDRTGFVCEYFPEGGAADQRLHHL